MRSQGSLSHRQQSTLLTSRATSTANADAVVTVAADSEQFWAVERIVCSYGNAGTLSTGRLTVVIGSDTLLDIDITDKQPPVIELAECPLYNANCVKGEALVVTLTGGGASVIGKLNVHYR